MTRLISIVSVALMIVLSACSQVNLLAPSPTPASGIEGTVTEGPMCPGPVQIGDNSCPDQPYQATISILDTNNTQIAQFQCDANGYFKVPLAPGTYILHPQSGTPLPRAADQIIVVVSGAYTQVTIVYDTGMR